MRYKFIVVLCLFAAGVFVLVYGSQHKAVDLKMLHLQLEAYYADYSQYPENITTLLVHGQDAEAGYMANLVTMLQLIQDSGYLIVYETDKINGSYRLQIRKVGFCKQLRSSSDLATDCH